jgi:tetratricopeptide (TPR) repeat protein
MQASDYNSLAEQIVAGQRWSVLTGAGISRRSGLPLANELVRELLHRLGASVDLVEKIIKTSLPFEVLMDTFVGISDDRYLFELYSAFSGGVPNTTHKTLAALALTGHIRILATTNFDLLLESALTTMKDSECFIRKAKELEFATPLIEDGNIILLKLHGSLDDPESLRATLKQVANRELSENRMRAVKDLFSTTQNDKVLIIGYSCSDIYDIIPAIRSVGEHLTEIVLIEHDNARRKFLSIPLSDVENDHTLKGLRGNRIRCNTDKLMECLARKLGIEVISSKPLHDWRVNLAAWETRLTSPIDTRPEMLGWILQKHQYFVEALEHHFSSAIIYRKAGDLRRHSNAMLNVGFCLRGLSNYKSAKSVLQILAITAEECGNKGDLLLAAGALVELAIIEGNIADAEFWANKCQCEDNIETLSAGKFHMMELLFAQKRYDEAYNLFLTAQRLYWGKMGLAARLKWLSIAGRTQYSRGESSEALELLENAVETARLINIGKIEGETRVALGEVLINEGQLQRAVEVLEPVNSLFPAHIKHREHVRGYMALAIAYHGLGNIDSALAAWEHALQIGEEHWLFATETVTILEYAAQQW